MARSCVESLRDLIEDYDREIAMLERRIHELLRDDRGYQANQALDGVGRTLGAIFVTEIGDGSKLVRWAALEAIVRYHGGPPLSDGFQRIAERRGTNKARIATARRLMTLVYYGLCDGETRCLQRLSREARTRPQASSESA